MKNLVAELEAVRAAHSGKTLQLWCEDGEAPEPLSREGQKGRTGHRWFTRGVAQIAKRFRCARRDAATGAFCLPTSLPPSRANACGISLARPRRRICLGAARSQGGDHCEIAKRFARDLFLAQFSETLPAGVHAVPMLDQAKCLRRFAGTARRRCRCRANVTLLPLPPYSPELNLVERVWLYLRERFLSFRLYRSEQAIVDALCAAWNALRDETGRLTTLTGFP